MLVKEKEKKEFFYFDGAPKGIIHRLEDIQSAQYFTFGIATIISTLKQLEEERINIRME